MNIAVTIHLNAKAFELSGYGSVTIHLNAKAFELSGYGSVISIAVTKVIQCFLV